MSRQDTGNHEENLHNNSISSGVPRKSLEDMHGDNYNDHIFGTDYISDSEHKAAEERRLRERESEKREGAITPVLSYDGLYDPELEAFNAVSGGGVSAEVVQQNNRGPATTPPPSPSQESKLWTEKVGGKDGSNKLQDILDKGSGGRQESTEAGRWM